MGTKQEKRIQELLPMAQRLQDKYGIPVSITIAQAIQESGWVTSSIAKMYNNWFGEKAFDSWKGLKTPLLPTTEEVNGEKVVTSAYFRWYRDIDEAIKGRGELLTNSRYGSLVGKDAFAWAKGLETRGYATDSSYAEALTGIIQSNNLTKYDKGGYIPPTPSESEDVIRQREKNTGLADGIDIDQGEMNFLSFSMRNFILVIIFVFTLYFLMKVFDVSVNGVVSTAEGAVKTGTRVKKVAKGATQLVAGNKVKGVTDIAKSATA